MRKDAKKQKNFFDRLAKDWRVGFEVADETFADLFPVDGLGRVLDVGCGTGVLTKYLAPRCRSVDAIDVSDEMIARAKKEFSAPNVLFSVADFYEYEGRYDCIFVFDAYPHFADKEGFARHAAELLTPGGELFIAFDESRQKIDAHHAGHAKEVSVGLRPPQEEARPFLPYFSVQRIRDDDRYLLVLKKRAPEVL